MDPLTLETALSERDVAVLYEWQEQQRQNVAELEAALDFERSQVARLMDLLIETQANENHYKRALEWLNEQSVGCAYPDGECYDIVHPGDLAPDCRPCRMALAMAAAHGRDLRAFWNEWVRNGNDTSAALAATKEPSA